MEPNSPAPTTTNEGQGSVPFSVKPDIVRPSVTPAAPAPANDTPTQPLSNDPRPMDVRPAVANETPAPTTMSPATTATTPASGAVVSSGDSGQGQPPLASQPTGGNGNDKKRWFKRKKIIIPAVTVLILALAGGYVFGIYLPNTPDNAYKTGLSRSGMALSKLTDKLSDDKQLSKYKSATVTGSLTASAEGSSFTGDLSGKFGKDAIDNTLNVTVTQEGDSAKKISAHLLAQNKADSTYPDLYLQLSGLRELGIYDLVPGLEQYDGRWIAVDGNYLKTLVDTYGGSDSSSDQSKQLTTDDVRELSKAVTASTDEYLFTTDPTKAVLVKKSYVGKEQVDGVTAYHYKENINQAHAVAFCKDITTKVTDTAAFKKLSGASGDKLAQQKADAIKDCEDKSSTKDVKDFDLWIESKYKLIHKVRVYDDSDASSYVEFGQTYKGGDDISFFVNGKSKSYNADFTVKTNMKTYISSGDLKLTGSGSSATNLTANFKVTPQTSDVTISKPADSVPLQTILQAIGVDPNMLTATPTSANASSSSELTPNDTSADNSDLTFTN